MARLQNLMMVAVSHAMTAAMMNSPIMPFHIMVSDARTISACSMGKASGYFRYFRTRLNTRPLAATEAICPATLALTACMIRILPGSSFIASL